MEIPQLVQKKCDDCECIINNAKRINAHLQLIGGWAIFYRTNNVNIKYDFLERKYNDIDVVGSAREKKKIYEVLQSCGYKPNERFNGLYGDTRLLFEKEGKALDVFLDRFEMCHKLDLSESLRYIDSTIGVGELLFTKLQIIEINEKDLRDILRLLLYTDLNDKNGRDYSPHDFIVNLCSQDWGIYKTLTMNLDKVQEYASTLPFQEEDLKDIIRKIQDLKNSIESAPKSIKWKMRAKIGESVKWYDLPEEKKR